MEAILPAHKAIGERRYRETSGLYLENIEPGTEKSWTNRSTGNSTSAAADPQTVRNRTWVSFDLR
jgi:hypothetical protein